MTRPYRICVADVRGATVRHLFTPPGINNGLSGDLGQHQSFTYQGATAYYCWVHSKICALVFDRYGDFDGFVLDTDDGEVRYHSQGKDLRDLAERAWQDRLRVTVWSENDRPHRVRSVELSRRLVCSRIPPDGHTGRLGAPSHL